MQNSTNILQYDVIAFFFSHFLTIGSSFIFLSRKPAKRDTTRTHKTYTSLEHRHDIVKTYCVIIEKINRDRNRFRIQKTCPLIKPPTHVRVNTNTCVQVVVAWSNFYLPSFDRFSFSSFLVNPLIMELTSMANLKMERII